MGKGEAAKVVPRNDIDVVTTSAVDMVVEEVIEVLFDQANEVVFKIVVEDRIDSCVDVMGDGVAVAMLDAGGGLYVTQLGGLLAGKSVQHK
jgi:hypothetical protein